MLVFGEEYRALELSDVMIEGSGAHEHGVGADGACGLCGEGGDLHGVLESAGSLLGEATQQRVVDIAQLHKGDC